MTLTQGAEAIVTKKGEFVLKERVAKSYRHPVLDTSLRSSRTKREAKILEKLAKLGFPVPKVQESKDTTLTLAFIDGPQVRDVLAKKPELAREIGKKVGILHVNNIIHGDLTTSNMILNNEVFFIDFGLSFVSTKAEDKAVDLHLLKQALESAHHEIFEKAFADVLAGYKESNPAWHDVLLRLEKVEKRGRNKK